MTVKLTATSRRRLRQLVSTLMVIALTTVGVAKTTPAHAIDINSHPPLKAIVDRMVAEDGFSRDELKRIFDTVEYKQKIIDSMRRPAERLKWFKYRPLFVTEKSARNGVAFIEKHREVFAQAEQDFGVPANVIAAIIGVETRYGRVQGKHRILDSLTTLTVGYPRRSAFFGSELREFLILSREENMDPLVMKGSYAGAMGIGQFISSSYRNYAIDYSGDGIRDLMNSPADAIGSVANYLKRRGWVRGGRVIGSATLSNGANGKEIANRGRKPDSTVSALKARGVTLDDATNGDAKASLIRLDGKNGPEYRGAYANFFAIMTYNPSQMYAMAVSELAQEIERFR